MTRERGQTVDDIRTIYFVCVNYNGSSFTKLWLESVFHQRALAGVQLACVVVDNASTREDYEALSVECSRDGRTRMVRSEKNLGYFGGLNLGLAAISPTARDFVVVGNNDIEFAVEFSAALVDQKYRPNVFVVAPDIITADGAHQNPHVPRRFSWLRRLKSDLYFSHYYIGVVTQWLARPLIRHVRRNATTDQPGEIRMGLGACYVLLPVFFEKCKTLYFPWFLFGEEACLAWQVRDKGGITWYDPTLVVHHAECATSSKLPSRVGYEYGREAYWGYRSLL